MGETRADVWIKSATSVDPFMDHLGQHLVAHPYGNDKDTFSGQLIALTPDHETATLRRYDTGELREFPWFTTNFKATVHIDSPFTELAVGMIRRFEWFHNDDGQALLVPLTLLGTVDKVTPDKVRLWVRDSSYTSGGWWAVINADDAARHSLRPPATRQPRE